MATQATTNPSAMTNCVLVHLPQASTLRGTGNAMQLLSFRQELESFGEVARAELRLDGDTPHMRVCYYDVRCAANVKASYGDSCELGPQEGERSIRMTQAAMEAMQLGEISNITSTEDGEFEVEFFDTRSAAHAASLAAAATACAEGKAEVETPVTVQQEFDFYAAWLAAALTGAAQQEREQQEQQERQQQQEEEAAEVDAGHDKALAEPQNIVQPGLPKAMQGGSMPVKVSSSLCMSQVRWDDFSGRREWRTALQLRGVPAKLCEPGALEELLKGYGLHASVASVRVVRSKGRGPGCAVIKARSVEDVPALAKFFHGSQFGNSMPIAVSYAAVGDDGLRRCGKPGAPAKCGTSLGLGEPQWVQKVQRCASSALMSESTASGSPRGSLAGDDAPSSPVTSPSATQDLDSIGMPPGLSDWVRERCCQAA